MEHIPPGKSKTPRSGGRRAKLQSTMARAQDYRMLPGTDIKAGFSPLSLKELEKIHQAALTLLEELGMANATPEAVELALAHGCSLSDQGRLTFPRSLVEDCIDKAAKSFVVHGRDSQFDFEARNGLVNFCTGGAAVTMLDHATRAYRPSTLNDLYDIARLCDVLENIQWFARPVVATDITDNFALDANTIFASAAGTRKHIATSIVEGSHVARLLPMLDWLAGGDGMFAQKPICSVHATTVVSPMSFASDSLDVAFEAVRIGMPIHSQTGPQAGATAPATLAGTLAQVCAEGLAALTLINMLKPGHPVIMGNWSFVSDLRTGAFSGGGGEQALLGAASGQIATFYGLPGGMGAGMTDSKLPDAQAGYEKALTLSLAALSGSGFVFESAGMMASLLGCSLEALIIDNEMIHSIRRIARGIEVTDDTLAVDVVKQAVLGEGHFLGAAQTLDVMHSEYTYPKLADRMSPTDWADAGSSDIWDRAAADVKSILASHRPAYIDRKTEETIRGLYPIQLQNSWTKGAVT